jgi:hypothetical protein
MTKLPVLWMVCVVLALGGMSCTGSSIAGINPTHTPTHITTPTPKNLELTDIVGGILASPNEAGEQVEVIGYFRGWDLLDELDNSPPVTRSDWVIADNSGAIYVTGKIPDSLNPSSLDQVNQVIHLIAVIRVKGEQVYLEAISVELLTTQ